jgi:flagellar motor switch/type III secretory pathway protein FliN
MTVAARPWLPANAVRDDALTRALSAHAERWAARWFAAPKPTGVRVNDVRSRIGIAADCACWTHASAGLVLAMAPTAHVPFASAMLGADMSAHKLSAQDHALLRRLASACAEDYMRTASSALGFAATSEATPSREAQAGFRFVLSMGQASQLLELYVDERAALAARRTLLGDAPRPARALASRSDAIGRQPIRLGAMVGTSKLGLGELRTLACGDVIVLDRGPGDAMTLAVNGRARFDTPCNIIEDNGALQMRLNGSHA